MRGYRTYIFAGLLAFASFANALGWIDDALYQALAGFLGAGGLAALRAGVEKK